MPMVEDDGTKKLDLPKIHECLMNVSTTYHDSGWECNGIRLKDGCFTGMTEYHQSKYIQRFECRDCDFDLCLNCAIYYSNVKE